MKFLFLIPLAVLFTCSSGRPSAPLPIKESDSANSGSESVSRGEGQTTDEQIREKMDPDNSQPVSPNVETKEPVTMPQQPLEVFEIPAIAAMLRVQSSGYCLDLPEGSAVDTELVQQQPCVAGINQLLKLKTSGKAYQLTWDLNGKCLEISNPKLPLQSEIQQMSCSESAAQLWTLEATSGAKFLIRSELDRSLCMEIDQAAPKSRALAQVAACVANAENQTFKFVLNDKSFVASAKIIPTLDEICTIKIHFTAEEGPFSDAVKSIYGKPYGEVGNDLSRKACKILFRSVVDKIPNPRVLNIILYNKYSHQGSLGNSGYRRREMKLNAEAYYESAKSYVEGAKAGMNLLMIHELTHAWQSSNNYEVYSGVYEGMAHAVVVKGGYAYPTMVRDKSGENWDEGYLKTALFFLYIEEKVPDFLYKLSQSTMAVSPVWTSAQIQSLTGKPVIEWWRAYQADASCKPNNHICGQSINVSAFVEAEPEWMTGASGSKF